MAKKSVDLKTRQAHNFTHLDLSTLFPVKTCSIICSATVQPFFTHHRILTLELQYLSLEELIMKIIQKLEVFAALCTLIAATLSFYFIVVPQMGQLENLGTSYKEDLLSTFLFLFLPAFLTLVGAYFHVTRCSIVGLILIFIFAGMMAFLHAGSFLIGDAFGGHPLLGVSPGLFALTTMLLALYSQSLAPPQPEIVKLR